MLQIGKFNHLEVVNQVPFGFYLDGGDMGQVLLPTNTVPQGCKVGDMLDVFIYHDSDDRIIATTKNPKAQVDQCAFLKVISITKVGAFLDWGLEKDLLVPFSEQDYPMAEGMSYVVYLFCDEETNRIAASTRLRDFLPEVATEFEPKQAVNLLICGRTDMGYKAVVNGSYLGLVFKDEIFKPIKIGYKLPGFIKRIREDGKIDLCFQFHDKEARGSLAEQIIEDLLAHGGLSTLTDKSPAEEISQRFNVSKAAYKKAIGGLFKQKRILLDKNKITLVENKG
ncbi:CvfB family protein [Paraglaciecola hydrolytica]|uniref:GntR family transcriptional regulator n=1 Tax=Paraglaciecola hydrolytica TaxID=1799789 RepID=A0A136A179_9ALTE|nr:S1-like domain-containing RNA-binding protein [Paraglaciecola hydrolytica]KXI28910.1 GntR family transcriptional regulator [Paraglaciecola hydrolytica]